MIADRRPATGDRRPDTEDGRPEILGAHGNAAKPLTPENACAFSLVSPAAAKKHGRFSGNDENYRPTILINFN